MALAIKGFHVVEAGQYIDLKLTGRFEKQDFDVLVPELEAHIKTHGKISMMLELLDFEGWSIGAAWEDTKFALRHFSDIERIAVVGDKSWEKGMTYFFRAFTHAKVVYFDVEEREEALTWLLSAN